ncbi:hypothetical protein GYMLUDRAFT_236540 [Collybiopsis luxurians FD-317 M1]|nr:hypothetical protein GYMLUDRAFT_236540 [Collybiopsis luxurians FD-317 M1]
MANSPLGQANSQQTSRSRKPNASNFVDQAQTSTGYMYHGDDSPGVPVRAVRLTIVSSGCIAARGGSPFEPTETTRKTVIPFDPFEASSSIDGQAPPIPRNLSTPALSLEAEGACSDLTSPKETAAPIPVSGKQPAGHPLPQLPDPELAPDHRQERRSPHSQASSPAPLLLSRPRHLSHDQVQMLAVQDDPYLVPDLEEYSTAMETRSHLSDHRPTAQGSHRFQPYRAPGARTGSGFHRQVQADLTSALDRGVAHRMDSSHTHIDREQRQRWDHQEPQTIMSVLDLAWLSGGKTIVSVNPPSLSMHHPSAPPEVASGDSQSSMRGVERMEPPNLDHSRDDLLSWNSANPKMAVPDALNPHLDLQGQGEFYSPPSGRETYTQQVADLERVAQGSSSAELQGSPLGTEILARQVQRQRALSYSQELRMQQEEQLRRLKGKAQAHQLSIVQTRTPPPPPQSPHQDPPQHRPHSLPMLPGHLLPDPGHPVHLARPSSRIDMDMGMDRMNNMGNILSMGMDSGALAAGNMGMGVHSRPRSNLQAQIYQEVPQQLARAHRYQQEAHLPQAPSRREVSMPGDDRVMAMGLGDDVRMGMGVNMTNNTNSYAYSNNFSLGMLHTGNLGLSEGESLGTSFSRSDDGRSLDLFGEFGSGSIPPSH